MKNTIAIILIIVVAISLGYAYDKISTGLEMKAYPLEYTDIVEKYSDEYSVPKEIVYGVIKTESGFRSDAKSSAGAVGLMQITEATFDWIASRLGDDLSKGLLYDPETNIKYGTYYLGYLYNELFKDWDIAFAAYNAGPNRVQGWIDDHPEYINGGEIIYIPIEETRNYIKKVNKSKDIYKKLYFSNN